MSNELTVERNVLIPMSMACTRADVIRPGGAIARPPSSTTTRITRTAAAAAQRVTVHRHSPSAAMPASARFPRCRKFSGNNPEPFASQEAKDGHEAIEWIAAQDWCDGNVGMWAFLIPVSPRSLPRQLARRI